MEIFVLWLVFALLVAWWASRVGVGWWTGFLCSTLLSPLIGAIIVAIMSTPRRAEPVRVEPVPPAQAEWYTSEKLERAHQALRGRALPPQPGRRAVPAADPAPQASAPPVTLTPQRMAEIEAEERFRAEVRARLEREKAGDDTATS